MGFENGGEFNDVLDDGYVSTKLNIGAGSETEAVAGGNALVGRECLTLTNVGSSVAYFGPSGFSSSDASDGEPLYPKQTAVLNVGPNIGVYLRCDTGDSTDVVVQEYA